MLAALRKENEGCFKCGDKKHWKRDCPKKANKKPPKSAFTAVEKCIRPKGVNQHLILKGNLFQESPSRTLPGSPSTKTGVKCNLFPQALNIQQCCHQYTTSKWLSPLFSFFNFYFIYLFLVVFVIHWHESAMDIHVFPIPIPPPTSLSTWFLWVFPVHQVQALVSCTRPRLVICFTLDNIHVLMLFSWNLPPSPSPTESKSLFYTSVSLFLFCI